MTRTLTMGPPVAHARPSAAAVAGLGLLLLALLLAWQGLLRYPLPDATAWRAPLLDAPSLDGLLLWWVQLPRVAAGLIVGASLGLAGALMQLITRNPLVSPDLLGITAGAQLGVILGMLLPATLGLPLIFAGGVLAALLTFALAGGWKTTPLRLILAGVAMAQTFAALITLFLSLNDQAAMVVSLWNTGSLQQLGWDALAPALWVLPPALLILLLIRRPLNMALLGDEQMRMLGLSPAWLKVLVVVLGSLLTALAIHLAGPLGFIGLVAPNLLRYGFGIGTPTRLVPLAALWGAVLTLLADALVAALDGWMTLPLGALSAVIGAIAVLLLLRYTQRATLVGQAPLMSGEQVRLRLPLGATLATLALLLLAALAYGTLSGRTGGDPLVLWQGLWQGRADAWVLLDLRLPRLLVDVLGGALLASSGLILQSVTRNPLASPEVLGVSQTAALAVLIGLILMPDLFVAWRFPLAWGGALLALLLVIGLNLRHGLEPLRLVLTGFALTGLVLGVAALLVAHYSSNIAQALIWMVGSSYGRTWSDVLSMLPWLALGLSLAWLARRWMDLLALGDGVADSLGLATAHKRLLLVLLASSMIAAAVAVLGPVAFIGLLVPHAVRLLGFHAYRERLLVAPLLGGVLLVGADLLGQRILAPLDIPLGIATAAIGAPCFLLLLSRTYFTRNRG